MPRSKTNREEFVAGVLPIIQINHPVLGKKISYFVDGRLRELRNVDDFMDKITCVDDDVWELLSSNDRKTITYEFYGDKI